MNVLRLRKDTPPGRQGISARQQLVCFESTEGCLCYSNVEVCGYLPQNNSLQKQTLLMLLLL